MTTTEREIRALLMLAHYQAGASLAEIGKAWGSLSGERVRQIITKMPGYKPRRSPGRPPYNPCLADRILLQRWIAEVAVLGDGLGVVRLCRAIGLPDLDRPLHIHRPGRNLQSGPTKSAAILALWQAGRSMSEVAAVVGVTVNRVGTALARARAQGREVRYARAGNERRWERQKGAP